MPIEIHFPSRKPVAGKEVCFPVTGVGNPPLSVSIFNKDGEPVGGVSVSAVPGAEMTYEVCFVYPSTGTPLAIFASTKKDGNTASF